MKQLLALALVLLLIPSLAQACLWDRDTLAMERARFPDVNELITGYFPRHSNPYYRWRIEQVLAIPETQRTSNDYDDLGVSYDKLGQHEQAIKTMLDKVDRFPNQSLYESHANLGTFYIHNGDLEQGVQYIGSAIEINPEAHFGREVYQKLLVEYVIQQRAEGNTLPLTVEEVELVPSAYPDSRGFASFVLIRQGYGQEQGIDDIRSMQTQEVERAIKGVLGMMRFGHYDSPILLEALGDLLTAQTLRLGVQRLAARAYLKASYEVDDPEVANHYRVKAERAVANQQNESLKSIESELKREIAAGDAYFAQIESDERAWIAAGADVDAAFGKKYYEQPLLGQSLPSRLGEAFRGLGPLEMLLLLLLVCLSVGAAYAGLRRWRTTRA